MKSRIIAGLVILLICCVFIVIAYSTQQSTISGGNRVQKALSKISKEDYAQLEQLFRILFFENYFAYTLFGSKPMTYHGAFYEQPIHVTIDNPNSELIFLTNWKIWEKYSKLPEFKSENFVFIYEKRPELFGIHFISKRNILSCVRDNIDIFKDILGSEINPEKVLQAIETSNDIYETLGDTHLLYGILFGFGTQNAIAFHQKFDLELPLPDPMPFHTEEPEDHPLPLPYFMTFFPNAETERLQKQYANEREMILSKYSKGDFLEITLRELLGVQ
jgi:hypothetical protein